MKRIFLVMFLFIGYLYITAIPVKADNSNDSFHLSSNVLVDTLPTDSLELILRSFNVASYTGMRVDSFLARIPNIPTGMFVSSCVMGRESMFNACYLQVSYFPYYTIRIYVNNFTHMPRYSATLSWDVNLFKQENLFRINIYKDNVCINGNCRY